MWKKLRETPQKAEENAAPPSPEEIAISYHERTKHHYHRYAAALGYMDWETQPDPFRRFEGATLLKLPAPSEDRTPPYEAIYGGGRAIEPGPTSIETISEFFFYSLALSAWKQYDDARWSLRVNPSSGNLHPTEGYLIAGGVEGLEGGPGVFHYAPKEHGLERRAEFSDEIWKKLAGRAPAGAFFVGLTSIHWRESWKYGERAFRYCNHDVGHAIAALRLSAAALGWRMRLLSRPTDAQVAVLLGVDRHDEFHEHERETPDLLAIVAPCGGDGERMDEPALSEEAFEAASQFQWRGTANQLSGDHHPWHAIDIVSEACQAPGPEGAGKSTSPAFLAPCGALSNFAFQPGGKTAGQIVRQRRSAVDMDGKTGMPRDRFYQMLARLVPALTRSPWDALPWPPLVHLGLFVHRLEGLPPGLHALARDPEKVETLKSAMRPEFRWERPPDCPDALPFYLLVEKDVRSLAASLSCTQSIAGAGAFSLGMIAEFEPTLAARGARFYKRLFWETGAIGQILYLEAEAAGLRGTGIGCFFDDPVHETFGLKGRTFQSLYHFTVGGPVEDQRLTTLPAYPD